MSSNETIYSFRVEVPDFIERGRTQVLRLPAYYQGGLAVPTAGSFTLYDSSGYAVVAAAPVTVISGVATYTLTAATIPDTTPTGDGWSEAWALAMPDSTLRTVRRMASIALREIFPAVSLANAKALHSSISSELLGTNDPTGQEKLELAWGYVYRKILARGNTPYRILNPEALFEPVLYKWLDLIFTDASTSMGDGRYKELAADYRDLFKAIWDETRLVIDTDEDGLPEGGDSLVAAEVPVFLSAATRPGFRLGWGW